MSENMSDSIQDPMTAPDFSEELNEGEMSEEQADYETRKIFITYGDIALLRIPRGAIFNPSNTGLILNGGVSEQIARCAGPLFQQQLHILRSRMRNNQLDLGRVIDTDAGHMQVKYLFHGSIIGRRATDIDTITTVLLNSFDLAERLGIKTIAFPAVGVGNGKISLSDFLDLFWRLANEELPRSESLDNVILCLFDKNDFDKTYEYIQKHEDRIGEDVEVEIVDTPVWQQETVYD